MLFSRLPAALCLSLLASLALADSTACTTSTITIHAWPLPSPSASPLAKIAETSCPSQPKSYAITSWTPPPPPWHDASDSSGGLVRVGHYTNGASSAGADLENWDGVLTSAAALAPGQHRTLTLLTDSEGRLAHVGFAAGGPVVKGGSAAAWQEEISVVARGPTPGAQPVLNRPVVLDESGKVKVDDKDERTFLQKYWWVLALFLVMQLVSAGGKE